MLPRQPNGFLVEAHGIQLAPFQPRHLGPQQRRVMGEILRPAFRPGRDLPVMRRERLPMPRPRRRRCRLATPGLGQPAIDMIFAQLDLRRHRPDQGGRFGRGVDRGFIIAGIDAGLKLPDPIARGGEGQLGVAFEVPLEAAFVEFRIVEGAESVGQAAQRADKSKLRDDDVADDAKSRRAPDEVQAIPGLALDIAEGRARGKKVRGHIESSYRRHR